MGWRTRIAVWAAERVAAEACVELGGGRLVWVDEHGVAHDLGPWSTRDAADVRWALGVAYRLTRDRGDRLRLGRARAKVDGWAGLGSRPKA
jgi:hypothetical protein